MSHPVFGRYEKFVLLLLGFALTTVGGAFLGAYLQNRSRFTTQQEMVFADVTKDTDTRAYRTESLIAGMKGDVEFASLETRQREYRASLEEWNVRRNRNSILVRRYFGPAAQRCFIRIHTGFLNVNRSIRRGSNLEQVSADVNQLQNGIQSFYVHLLTSMNQSVFSSPVACRIDDIPIRSA